MTFQSFVFSAHQRLLARACGSIKRSHVHELLSAGFGFKSYAALRSSAVFSQQSASGPLADFELGSTHRRGVALGYPMPEAELLTSELAVSVADAKLEVVTLVDLVHRLRGASVLHYEPDDYSDDAFEIAPMLRGELENSADAGHAVAHFALALICASTIEDDSQEAGSAHWFEQEQQGQVLTGFEKERADSYRQRLALEEKHQFHLTEAARLGIPEAMLEAADRWQDDSFFVQDNSSVDEDPSRVADIAERLGRRDDAKQWLTCAAEAGDTDAMRRLIDGYDSNDLERCWTWLYLAQKLGVDFTQSHFYAINEDGSDFDDDVGGPAYAAGEDGLELERLSADQDAGARKNAERLFNRLSDDN